MGDWVTQFGHRRLSIIDIEGGAQPMESFRTGSAITFNGEIFNFQELSDSLRADGVELKTRSDTEVLLELLVQTDLSHSQTIKRVLKRLNGMFAFGFWDTPHAHLLLARDRFGIKPLYYVLLGEQGRDGIAFASELTALLEFAECDFDRRLDPQGLTDYFFHDSIPAPYTAVRGIRKLGVGEYLSWQPGKAAQIERYWSPSEITMTAATRIIEADEAELSRELLEKLDRAVGRQMISDVPVGVFLSGGIDSSVITALAARHSSSPIETFSIGFEEKSFDESEQAKAVSEFLGTRHHVEILSEARMIGELDETLGLLDEPLGDVSILPTYQVAKLAHRTVKVCLGGDGGDELFAGYPFYGAHVWGDRYRKIPGWIRQSVLRPLVGSLPVRDSYQSFEWKAKRFTHRFDESKLRRHFRWLASTDLTDLTSLLPVSVQPSSFAAWRDAEVDSLDGLLRLDLGTYLPGSVLTKVDRATMGTGVEARPPFLDNEVVEFALRLPSSLKLKGGVTKYLLKKTAASLLPEEVLHRKKQGFSVPIARWTRGALKARIAESVENSELFRAGFLDLQKFREILTEHATFRKDWGKTLWSFYVLDQWYRKNSGRLRARL